MSWLDRVLVAEERMMRLATQATASADAEAPLLRAAPNISLAGAVRAAKLCFNLLFSRSFAAGVSVLLHC